MTQHVKHFDDFQPHTRLKHRILDTYIVAWAMKLFMGRVSDRLAIVDAFAGPGRDGQGREGSPLIAVRRARDAMREARGKRPHLADPKIFVFCIEKKRTWFRQLEENLASERAQTPELIHILEGTLLEHMHHIHATIGNCPTFFFLDPFGIKGLDARTYQKALSGPHNELFALFANIGAVRLHGVVTAERADASSEIARILAAPSLFPEQDAAAIDAARDEAARLNEALDASIPASREHITLALGGNEWMSRLDAAHPGKRADTFLDLFRQRLTASGARYVLTVPMRNDAGQPVYALVHASKSAAAFVTMKDAVSSGLRRGELSSQGSDAIKEALSIDVAAFVDWLRGALAGRTMPWADEEGLRALLLASTELFHFQAKDVKALLKRTKILRRANGREVCVFPSVA